MLFESAQIILVVAVAFGASVLGGVAGYGTGLLLPPILVPLIGAEAVVPVIGLSALLTNISRVLAFRADFDFAKFWRVAVWAAPTTIAGAYGYSLLSGPAVSILIGTVLIVLVPARRWFKSRQIALDNRGVSVAGFGYGIVVGGTAGSGVILLSILMGAGLSGPAVIATDAAISLVLGTLKTLTFAGVGALPWPLVITALLIGFATMPGAFIAKKLSLRLSGNAHIFILDGAVLIGGCLLIWRGLTA